MDENNSGGAFVVGFLLGALAGAAAALLYTPQSGEKTRFLIQEKGIELKTQVGDRMPTHPEEATVEAEEVEAAVEAGDVETAADTEA